MYRFAEYRKTIIFLSLVTLVALPLMADKKSENPQPGSTQSSIPDAPSFSVKNKGETLECSPVSLVKKKDLKDLVKYRCRNKNAVLPDAEEENDDELYGQNDTERLRRSIEDRTDEGVVYTVRIPQSDVNNIILARFSAKQQLNNRFYAGFINKLLPAKLYVSFRPQLANNGEQEGMSLQNGGTRGGFFYYRQFKNNFQLSLHYEAAIDHKSDVPFINISNGGDSSRRLSYFSLQHDKESILFGKNWSVYYDIAGLTDNYMAFGGQAGGAFNAGTHGNASGTGRAERVVQVRTSRNKFDVAVQVQTKHDAPDGIGTDYSYGVSGSLFYKEWSDVMVGASFAYAKFDEFTPQMRTIGIDGNDLSSILGIAYKHKKFSANAILSYTENHMNDDQGIYFDSVGAELYLRYNIGESFRLAGGGNWLIPSDNDYKGDYNIKNTILSLQYTFGEKTFDDIVYLEVSIPKGELANGDKLNTSVAIGLRYLFNH
ncbi:MAG: hypothetical protein U9Q90_00735 [Campylobacterota bacterium]|nr:hypothetical protein [Campylobacterota bacterium]